MRRLIVALLSALVVASMPLVASAEGPKVGGLVLVDEVYQLGQTGATVQQSTLLGRVNVSGDASESLSYYIRLQSLGDVFSVPLLYGTLKNVGVQGLNIGVGRQAVTWSIVNNYFKFYRRTGNVPGFTASYKLDPLSIAAFYTLENPNEYGARASYSTKFSGADVSVSGQVFTKSGWETPAFGANGSVGLGNLGSVYVEAGQGTRDDAKAQYAVVGANVDVIKQATGISGWVEYSVKDKKIAFSVGRELVPGFTLYFGGTKPQSGKADLSVTGELYLTF